MTIYIDADFKCHTQSDGTMREIETDFFDGKCTEFIEGYRFVPMGEIMYGEDGTIFYGEMIAPWKDYYILELAQKAYEDANTQYAQILLNFVTNYEKNFIATQNYEINSLIIINNIAYKTLRAIPRNGQLILAQNIVQTTLSEYLEDISNE